MRTLTRRELNRALLARQLLLERADMTLPAALEQLCGIQAQYAPSMYFGLWSRLEGFAPAALTRALEQSEVVQGTLMRVTIHLVSPRDYWPFALAVRDARRQLWLRAWKEPDADAMTEAARTLREALAENGALPRKEVEALIGKPAARGIHLWLDIVRVPPSGTWERRRADLFGLADAAVPTAATDPDDAFDHLVRRYLAAFGPASRKDVQSFTGLSLTTLKPVLERVATERYRDEDGGELLDVPGAPLPDPHTPSPPRLLPTWDSTLLVHARRTGLLPERFRPLIFHVKNPPSSPTFLVDGEVAGTWKLDAKDGFSAEPFERVPAPVMREVRAEGERLAAAFG
jgi:hypothetical protein